LSIVSFEFFENRVREPMKRLLEKYLFHSWTEGIWIDILIKFIIISYIIFTILCLFWIYRLFQMELSHRFTGLHNWVRYENHYHMGFSEFTSQLQEN
jgi:hypothetical protein